MNNLLFLILLLAYTSLASTVFIDNFNNNPNSYNPDAGTGTWQYLALPNYILNSVNTTHQGSRVELSTDLGAQVYPRDTLSAFANTNPFVAASGFPFEPVSVESGEIISMEYTASVKTESSSNPLSFVGVSDDDMRRGHFEMLMVDVENGQFYGFFVSGTEVYIAQDSSSAFGTNVNTWTSVKLVKTKSPEDINSYRIELNRDAQTVSWYFDDELEATANTSVSTFGFIRLVNDATTPPPYNFVHQNLYPAMANIYKADFLNPRPDSMDNRAMFPLHTDTSELLIPAPGDYLINDLTCFKPDNTIATDPTIPARCPLFEGVKVTATVLKLKVDVRSA